MIAPAPNTYKLTSTPGPYQPTLNSNPVMVGVLNWEWVQRGNDWLHCPSCVVVNGVPSGPTTSWSASAWGHLSWPSTSVVRDQVDGLQNPRETSFANTDCVTCHATRRWDADVASSTSPRAFVRPPELGAGGVVGSKALVSMYDNDTRQFGYYSGRPSVARRTYFESIVAAQKATELLCQ